MDFILGEALEIVYGGPSDGVAGESAVEVLLEVVLHSGSLVWKRSVGGLGEGRAGQAVEGGSSRLHARVGGRLKLHRRRALRLLVGLGATVVETQQRVLLDHHVSVPAERLR